MVTKTYLPTYLCDSSDSCDSCDSSDSSESSYRSDSSDQKTFDNQITFFNYKLFSTTKNFFFLFFFYQKIKMLQNSGTQKSTKTKRNWICDKTQTL